MMACGVEWRARVRTALKAEHREGGADRGCRAACVAGAWRPRGERALTRSGAARGNRRGAALRQAGPAWAAGPKARLRPNSSEM